MSFQSCPTLCDPMDYSPPGSSVHGISQAEYWSGLPLPSPVDFPDPGIKPGSPMAPALQGGFFTTEPLGNFKSQKTERRPPKQRWRNKKGERSQCEEVVKATKGGHIHTSQLGSVATVKRATPQTWYFHSKRKETAPHHLDSLKASYLKSFTVAVYMI